MQKILSLFLLSLAFHAARGMASGTIDRLISTPEARLAYPALGPFEGGTVLMIFAHADDELSVVGQLSHLQRTNPHINVQWILVTDNSGGREFFSSSSGDVSQSELRHREALRVSKCLGFNAPIMMGLPDGDLSKVKDLKERIQKTISAITPRPVAVFTHDRRGLYGHADHRAVYQAVKGIIRGQGIPLISAAVTGEVEKLWCVKMGLKARGVTPAPVPVTHAFDVPAAIVERKSCASRQYGSQRRLIHFWLPFFSEEYFRALPREFFNVIIP